MASKTQPQQPTLPPLSSLETPKLLAETARGLLWHHLRAAHKEQQKLLELGQLLPVRQTQQLAQISRSMDQAREVANRLFLLQRDRNNNPMPLFPA